MLLTEDIIVYSSDVSQGKGKVPETPDNVSQEGNIALERWISR